MTSLAAVLWTAQPQESLLQALHITIHNQQMTLLGRELIPFQRDSQHILQPKKQCALFIELQNEYVEYYESSMAIIHSFLGQAKYTLVFATIYDLNNK